MDLSGSHEAEFKGLFWWKYQGAYHMDSLYSVLLWGPNIKL